ncbi:MAG TPA: asparagine synthase (glutamine-hydrolyzing) [Bacteroidetes bacterium]|nr:asparagine synthase (glutamine-hydrolyzing) [Bacteroidota bacterium]
MCGIAGIFNLDGQLIDRSLLQRMSESIKHRGPDDDGLFTLENVGLVHRRLSIIDLSAGGHQPMHSHDGGLTIVFNGEIYNYPELRKELRSLGQPFRSQSDTEVILQAYRQWGTDCLKKLSGMFSFAIWDQPQKQLFCARDRFGIKPFYYFDDGVVFAFASEMKALLLHSKISRQANEEIIYDFLNWGMLDHTENSFFAAIKQLPAAHYLLVSGQGFTLKKYWDFKVSREIYDSVEGAERFREQFERVIRRHLRSDVPVGFLLSGGLDSSAIVCMADEVEKKRSGQSPERRSTFSAHFPFTRLDEAPFIREVLQQTGIPNHFVVPRAGAFLHEMDNLIYHQEEPFAGMSIYAQWCLMREVRHQGVKVVLDGQGADEQLCGYRKFYYFYLSELLKRKQWSHAIREAASLLGSISFFLDLQLRQAVQRYSLFGSNRAHSVDFLDAGFARRYSGRELPLGYAGNLAERIKLDMTRFSIPVLLRHEDRNSMAFSVESRVPFLDHEFVEFLASLPFSQKMNSGWTKYVMRRGLSGVLPRKIQLRKSKLGFQVPEDAWFRKILLEPVSKTFRNTRFIDRFVNLNTLKKSFAADFGGKITRRPASFYFRFFILEHWARVFQVD